MGNDGSKHSIHIVSRLLRRAGGKGAVELLRLKLCNLGILGVHFSQQAFAVNLSDEGAGGFPFCMDGSPAARCSGSFRSSNRKWPSGSGSSSCRCWTSVQRHSASPELIALIAATVAATSSVVPAIAVPGTAYSSPMAPPMREPPQLPHPPSQLLAPPIGRTG